MLDPYKRSVLIYSAVCYRVQGNFQENGWIEEKVEEGAVPAGSGSRSVTLFSDFPFIRGPPFSFDLPLRYNGQEIYTVR